MCSIHLNLSVTPIMCSIHLYLASNTLNLQLGHGKCSKILNTGCLPTMPRKTAQTQARLLLLQKQSDQGLPCLLFWQAIFFLRIPALITNIYYERMRKSVWNFRTFTLTLNAPIATKVICFSLLLKCLRSLYGKQCGPRSDCSSVFGPRCLLLYLIHQ